MESAGFIVPGGSQDPPAFAPGVAVRATMEMKMLHTFVDKADIRSFKESLTDWGWGAKAEGLLQKLKSEIAGVVVDEIFDNKSWSKSTKLQVIEDKLFASKLLFDQFEIAFDITDLYLECKAIEIAKALRGLADKIESNPDRE